MFYSIVSAIIEILGLFSIGWIARRLEYVKEQEINRWSRFAIDILFPPMVFVSMVRGFDPGRINELWPLPLIGLGIVIIGACAGLFLQFGLRSRDPDVLKTFRFFCAFNNYGFLPIIIVSDLWGQPGLANLFFLNLGSTLGLWTIGVGILGGSDFKSAVKSVFTPTLGALFLGLVFAFSRVRIPEFLLNICQSAGSAAIPLILVLIGASLFGVSMRDGRRDLAYITAVRLLFFPIIFIFILRLMPVSQDVYNIAVIVALMPVGASSPIFVRRFGGSSSFAVRAAVMTTLISIITVPVGVWLLAR